MAKFKKIKLNKIKDSFNKTLRSLAEHSFLTFLSLFIISLALGIIIFFQCSILIESPSSKILEEKSFQPEANAYKNIQDTWKTKKEFSSQTEPKKYSNPFLR